MKPVALITGGSRGIGLGIAIQLAKIGYDLAINGVRNESEGMTVLEDLKALGAKVHYIQGDISKGSDRDKIVNEMIKVFGIVHVLVNNAGVAPRTRADVLEVSEADFDELMGINMKGTFFLTTAIANWMVNFNPPPRLAVAGPEKFLPPHGCSIIRCFLTNWILVFTIFRSLTPKWAKQKKPWARCFVNLYFNSNPFAPPLMV